MRKTFLTGLGAIALAVSAGAATAQTPPAPPAGAPAPHHARGEPNRQITRAQFVDARVARLTALDTNRDGMISVEERQAAMQARRAAHADERFAKLDANGDGSISRAEFDAGHAARPDRGPHVQPAGAREGRRGGPRHAMPGPGRDGHERGPVVISEVVAKLGERFDKMDADHDGMISPAERRAAMTAHRADRQARRAQRQAGRPGPQAASPAPASE